MTINLDAGIKKAKEIKRESLGDLVKDNFVEATGMLVFTTPVFAALETIVPKYLGYSESIISKYLAFPELIPVDSIDARVKTAIAMYVGFGLLFSKGRDISRAIFNVKKESSGNIKKVHDSIYATAIGMPAVSALYFSNGNISTVEAVQAVVASTIGSTLFGWMTGLGIDYMRDLLQDIKSVRVPKIISDLPRNAKYAVAAIIIAGSVGKTMAVYEVKDYIDSKKEIKVNNLESKIFENKIYDTTNDFYRLVKN